MTATDWRSLMRGWLTGYAPLHALIGDRVYAIRPPRSPVYPFIVYQVVNDPEIMNHHGPALVQLSVYGSTYDSALAVRDLVRKAREPDNIGGIASVAERVEAIDLAGDREDDDQDAGWYRQDQDVHILHVKRR